MSRPPLHALQGFIAAARSGNVSRAAESLHLTVSALSHQIRGLEERVGLRLFVRGARGVQLTEDGRALFERIAPHLDAIEQALHPYRVRRDDALTLTLMPSFASSWLVRDCRASSRRTRSWKSACSRTWRWSTCSAPPPKAWASRSDG